MKQTTVKHQSFLFPSGLLTVEEMARELEMSEERLSGLAEACYCPHYRVDGSAPLFSRAEVRQWARKSLVERCDGCRFPTELTVLRFDGAEFAADPIPPTISNVAGLCRLPMVPRVSGVYFLCKQREVEYVGQSVDVPSRVRQHPYDYDAVFFLPVPREHLNQVEGAFIRTLAPRENDIGHGTPSVQGDPVEVVAALSTNHPKHQLSRVEGR
jgi:hypothetical protein